MPKWILLVEDEELVLMVTKEMLEHLGYQVFTARNGSEALEKFTHHKEQIGLIILDFTLPDINGGSCLLEIRKCSSTPALLMTGYGEEFALRKCEKYPFQGILTKPFSFDKLSMIISPYLPPDAL